MLTPEKLNKLKKQQSDIMNEFISINKQPTESNPHIHTEVKPIQVVNVYKDGTKLVELAQIYLYRIHLINLHQYLIHLNLIH